MFSLLLAVIYLSFISLGLPDSLLGSAWPTIYPEMAVPVSYAGLVSTIISAGTVISSLCSDHMTRRFGCGKVTAFSVASTAIALLGFSASNQFWQLCLWAVPYGLGAGSVDASLNNYVALHYASRHMSWLHCMWGVGTSVGPYIMGLALSNGLGWHSGYRFIALLQILLTTALFLSLPLWKKSSASDDGSSSEPLIFVQILRTPGAKEIMGTFFFYCGLEQTAILWASSYLTLHQGLSADRAASYASLFCIGITIGRAISGFITMKLNDTQMVRLGQGIILFGTALMLLPLSNICSLMGLILIGLGCAPIYPCCIHSTPAHFGVGKSQALIGVQMASAYVGTCLLPPLFGFLTGIFSVEIMPLYLLLILLGMIASHEMLLRKTAQ